MNRDEYDAQVAEHGHNVIPELLPHLMPIDDVKPHPDNSRVGDVEFVKASLIEHGQYRVAIAGADGLLALGNHMWMAAKQLGWTHLAAVTRPLSPLEARRLRVTDNRSHDRGRYDEAKLLAELDAIVASAAGDQSPGDALAGVGFDQTALFGLRKLVEQPQPAAPAAPEAFRDPEDNLDTEYQCPSCNYEWSGNPKGGA